MSADVYDCKTLSPQEVGAPYYHQCFGWRPLPNAFNVTVGPFTDQPGKTCYMADKSQRTGTLVRQSVCNFIWEPSFSYQGPGIALYVDQNTVPLSQQVNQNAAGLFTWKVNNEIARTSAGCSQTGQPHIGAVTFEIVGEIGDDFCKAPYRIWIDLPAL